VWFYIAETLGVPIWYAKSIIPSSEYTLWKARFAQIWTEETPMSYEFALLRYTIAASLGGGENLKLKKFMLSEAFGPATKEWEWMTDEEKAAYTAKSKMAWGG